jgi:hypothetical protein
MAFSPTLKDAALQMFIERKSLPDISKELSIPLKTLYNWKNKHDWQSYLRMGRIEMARSVEQEVYKMVQEMMDKQQLGNPTEVDKLAKLSKALERLNPKRDIFNNLFTILEGITDYTNRAHDAELTKVWQKHLKPIGQHLKNLFAPKE